MAGIRTRISVIVDVLNSRTEGVGLNAVCRIFNVAKNTVLDWEKRMSPIKQVLLLYALLHQFFQVIIEGDELYTKVGKNTPPDKSLGWTVVLIDRASRFLWEIQCGKNSNLFRKAIRTMGQLIDRTKDISLIARANHYEAFNSSLRRCNAAYRWKSNTYAKNEESLQRTPEVYWAVHNFIRFYFTTKKVPAVAMGIISEKLSWEQLFMIQVAAAV